MAGFYGGARGETAGALAAAAGKIASAFGYTTEYIFAHNPQWLEWALAEAALKDERAARLACALLGLPEPNPPQEADGNQAALSALGLGAAQKDTP